MDRKSPLLCSGIADPVTNDCPNKVSAPYAKTLKLQPYNNIHVAEAKRSKHTIVYHVAQEHGACAHVSKLAQRTKCNFRPNRSSMVSFLNKTKFVLQVLAYQGRLCMRSEVNCTSHSYYMSFQKVAHFFIYSFFFAPNLV